MQLISKVYAGTTDAFIAVRKTVSNLKSFINDEGELIDIIDTLINDEGILCDGIDDVLNYPGIYFCEKYWLTAQPETIPPKLLALYTPSIITEDVITAVVGPTHTKTSKRVQDVEEEDLQEEKTTTACFFKESQNLPAPTDPQHGNSANVKLQIFQGIKIPPALPDLQQLKRHSADIAVTSSTKGEATCQETVCHAVAHQEVAQEEAAHRKNAHLKLKYHDATVPLGKVTHAPTRSRTKPQSGCRGGQGGRKNRSCQKANRQEMLRQDEGCHKATRQEAAHQKKTVRQDNKKHDKNEIARQKVAGHKDPAESWNTAKIWSLITNVTIVTFELEGKGLSVETFRSFLPAY